MQAETKILGDGIVEFNPANEIVWEWSSFDHLPPPDTSGWNGVDPPLFDWLTSMASITWVPGRP